MKRQLLPTVAIKGPSYDSHKGRWQLYLFQKEQHKKITKAVSSAGVSCTIQSCIFPGHLVIILCWFNSSEVRGCSYSSVSWQGYLCENGLAGIGQYFACAFSLLFFFAVLITLKKFPCVSVMGSTPHAFCMLIFFHELLSAAPLH